jgi:hypothetical protein
VFNRTALARECFFYASTKCYQVLWEWNKLITDRHFLNTMWLLQAYLLAKILDTSHAILKDWKDMMNSVLCQLKLLITLLKLNKTRENKTFKVKKLLCQISLWFHKHRPKFSRPTWWRNRDKCFLNAEFGSITIDIKTSVNSPNI